MNGNTQHTHAIDDETRAHQEQTSKIRFKQNLIQGFAGPCLFGIFFAVGSVLLKSAGFFSGTALLATGGLVAMAITGVVCLYVGSRLTSELVNLEQTRHAAQIAKGINGVAPVIEQKPVPYPSHDKALDVPAKDAPQTIVNNPQLQDKVVAIDALEKARA